jgi:hypothetical protein
LLDSLGGWSGSVTAAIPPVVFVVVNAFVGLRDAVIAAVATGSLLAGYRMVRRQSVQQAFTGLIGVLVAAAIAARTGQARGYFLVGIVAFIGYACVFAASLLARRPLVGVLWEFLDPSDPHHPGSWRRAPRLLRAYDVASVLLLTMFVARAAVQAELFSQNRTGWLAVTRLAMGYPLYAVVLGAVFVIVRRARRSEAARNGPNAGSGGSGGADGSPDGRLGLGHGDEE